MHKPLWYETLCTKRYNKRQQAILEETARLIESRQVRAKNVVDKDSAVITRH